MADGLKAIVVVVVIMGFDEGNGAYEKLGFFTSEGGKHPMSSFLDISLYWDLSLVLFPVEVFLNKFG